MSELTPEIAAEVVAACEAGAEEAIGALGRSLDGEFTLTVGEATTYSSDAAPEGFDGAGLAVLMKFGDIGVAALIPESSGLLPDWYANPDPTGVSKLSTLAQELSMLLVPETLMADSFEAARVEQLQEALTTAEVADDAAMVPLELVSGDTKGQLSVVWPLASPDKLIPTAAEEEPPVEEKKVAASPPPIAAPSPPVPSRSNDFTRLPGYSRSLLRIDVPVRVVLASKKESLTDIIELANGTIIQFDKACDEPLMLHVGDQPVAQGEAVKVGDKFGFRISAMLMPSEHFMGLPPRNAG